MEPMTALGEAATLPARHPHAKRIAHSRWTERHFGWLLVAPGALVILALSLYPLLYSVWVAFVNYDFLVPGHAFVGWGNFRQVLADPVALQAVVVTLVLAGLNVFVEFVLGFALALAMSGNFRGRSVLMSLFIVPLFVSPVIVGQFWALLLQRPFGPTDYLLSLLLRHPVEINWLSEFPWNFVALMLADAWQWTPFMFVILLAGLSALPAEPYEAAEMDGANRWQTFVPHHVAADGADDPAGRDLPAARRGQTVRHRLHDDRRRAGQQHLHGVVLPLPDRVRTVPSVGSDRRKLDVPYSDVGRHHLPGAPADAFGGALMSYRRNRPGVLSFAMIALFAVFVILPLYWVVITSIKPSDDYLATPPVFFPTHPTLLHYTAALFAYRGLAGLLNSVIVATATTRVARCCWAPAWDTASCVSTPAAGIWRSGCCRSASCRRWRSCCRSFCCTGILDFTTRGPDWCWSYTVFTLPLSAWLMYTYFRHVPRELEDAALVDGASRWQAFWRVAVPLAAPGIAAAAVFAFIAVWTEFFFALILTSRYAFTLPTVFRSFTGFQGAQYGESSALAVTSLVPSIVLGHAGAASSGARADDGVGAGVICWIFLRQCFKRNS